MIIVVNNQTLHSLSGLKQIWNDIEATPQYYPMVHSILWLEYHLWGLHPLGYHLINVFLHLLSAFLLWRLMLRLKMPHAWLIACVFAMHPVMVESVAWITELKNVLSAVLYFSSALLYLRFASVGETEVVCKKGKEQKTVSLFWCFYLPSFLFFIAALWSKTVTASLPAALLLVIFWKRGRIALRDVYPLLPFFIVGVSFGLLTSWIERTHVGASGPEWSWTFWEHCIIAGRAIWFYAGKLCWPINLSFIYPQWQINSGVWWQWMFLFSALALVIILWCFRGRIGRGPLVAVLFFGGTLFPALGFSNVYPMRFSFVADHFQYLASVGLIALGVAGFSKMFRRTKWAAILVLFVLAGLTWKQSHIYANRMTLWKDTLAKNPDCWLAHNDIGVEFNIVGQNDRAIDEFREAIRLKPDYAEAHYNLGNEYVRIGRFKDAIDQFQQTINLQPDLVEARNNLGNTFLENGQLDLAIIQFQKAVRLKPDFTSAHFNFGIALNQNQNFVEAINQFETVIRLQPDYPKARTYLGAILLNQGKVNEAVSELKQAILLNPNDAEAHQFLAAALQTRSGN